MTPNGTVNFRVADFSEQFQDSRNMRPPQDYDLYSVVMHVDGEVLQWRKALRPGEAPPISYLRTEAWLELLKTVAEKCRAA